MAKTIEELKESINNTINQNGSGQITGQGLNILLNEMADVLSTMGGNSGNNNTNNNVGVESYRIYMSDLETGELTTEEQSHNASVFKKIFQKVKNGEFVNVYINMNYSFDGESSISIQAQPLLLSVGKESNIDLIMMKAYISPDSTTMNIIIISDDGDVMVV